jgi:hypothetical protein
MALFFALTGITSSKVVRTIAKRGHLIPLSWEIPQSAGRRVTVTFKCELPILLNGWSSIYGLG